MLDFYLGLAERSPARPEAGPYPGGPDGGRLVAVWLFLTKEKDKEERERPMGLGAYSFS